jgi:hypothetical protein
MLYLKQQLEPPPLSEAVGCICVCEGRLLLLKRISDVRKPLNRRGHLGKPLKLASGQGTPSVFDHSELVRLTFSCLSILFFIVFSLTSFRLGV